MRVFRTNLESEAVNIRPGKIIQLAVLPFHLLKKNISVYILNTCKFRIKLIKKVYKPFKNESVYPKMHSVPPEIYGLLSMPHQEESNISLFSPAHTITDEEAHIADVAGQSDILVNKESRGAMMRPNR